MMRPMHVASSAGRREPLSPRGIAATMAILVFAMLAGGCGADKPPAAGPLGRYPMSPALKALADTHAEAASDREERLALMTWFLNGDPGIAVMCSILPDGHVTTYRYLHDAGAIQDSRSHEMESADLSRLFSTLNALPGPSRRRWRTWSSSATATPATGSPGPTTERPRPTRWPTCFGWRMRPSTRRFGESNSGKRR